MGERYVYFGNMPNLKRCRRCQKIKKESQFRYIKVFRKRRSICKRCEALERHKRKRLVEKHVEDTWSYTRHPGKAPPRNKREGKEKKLLKTVLAGLPKKKRKTYLLGQLIGQLVPLVFILVTFGLTIEVFSANPDRSFTVQTVLIVADIDPP